MNQPFWVERWRSGQIGFHLPEANPSIVRHAGRLSATGAPVRVLVPLCGKSNDLEWLAKQGHEVVGIEFVRQGAAAYFSERGVEPETTRVGSWPALRHERVTIVVADFFALGDTLAPFPAAIDRAALIAIEPARRREYIDRLHGMLLPDARLLLVTLDHDLGTGPPFAVSADALAEIARDRFRFDLLDDVDVLADEPRFRDRGATYMREQVWLGHRSP